MKELIIEGYYKKYAIHFFGFDPYSLIFKNYNVKPKVCRKCNKNMHIHEYGLNESNVCLYLKFLKEKDVPVGSFCIGKRGRVNNGKKGINPPCKGYALCYTDDASAAVEEAVKTADYLGSVINGILSAADYLKKLEKYKKIDEKKIEDAVVVSIKEKIKERRKMWAEIEEGVRRVLHFPLDRVVFDYQNSGNGFLMQKINGFSILSCHGHQFRDLIRSDGYLPYGLITDIFVFGHFHRLAIFKRYGTWVLIGGHGMKETVLKLKGVLSHTGCSAYLVSDKSKHPVFNLFRM